MKKKRKLFCEYGPICYKISLLKEALKKDLKDIKLKRSQSTLNRIEREALAKLYKNLIFIHKDNYYSKIIKTNHNVTKTIWV